MTHVTLDIGFLYSSITCFGEGFGVVGVVGGGILVEGLADDLVGVGTIGVEGLAVWRDVPVWCDDNTCEVCEGTKKKVVIILRTF